MATQLSRKRRVPDWRNPRRLRFEWDDVHSVSKNDVTAGVALIFLSHLPIAESLKLWWRSVFQAPTEYTVDLSTGLLTITLAAEVQIGDLIKVHYAYREELPEDQVSWSVVATRAQESGYNSGTTSFALPAGTLPTDIMVFAQLGGFNTGATYSVTDSRLEIAGESTVGGRPCGLYVGYVGDGSAIAATLSGGNNAFGQFAIAGCLILRGGDRRLYYDINRSAVAAEAAGNSGVVPALPGAGSGSVAVAFAAGGTGGAYGFFWDETAPYSGAFTADNTYALASFGTCREAVAPEVPTPTDDPNDYTRAMAIGLVYAR